MWSVFFFKQKTAYELRIRDWMSNVCSPDLDAGHGGQDPGAIGKSGRREKYVTLAVSRELARQVNATPGLQAYLTRDKDVFIPLNRRAQLARAAKADIRSDERRVGKGCGSKCSDRG